MKEITLSFTPEELRELAKQLYLGSYFTSCVDYDNDAVAKDIFNRVCATGFKEAPETGAFRYGGPTETAFNISVEVDDECTPLVEIFGDDYVQKYLPYALAGRDFQEQYGHLEAEKVFTNASLNRAIEAIQKKYIDNFETYGVTRLRLEEPD
jgi:hypothetical protein